MKTIKINGEEHKTDSDTIDYTAVTGFAGYGIDRTPSVTYRGKRIGDSQRSGVLAPGKFVVIEDGMIFNVAETGNA